MTNRLTVGLGLLLVIASGTVFYGLPAREGPSEEVVLSGARPETRSPRMAARKLRQAPAIVPAARTVSPRHETSPTKASAPSLTTAAKEAKPLADQETSSPEQSGQLVLATREKILPCRQEPGLLRLVSEVPDRNTPGPSLTGPDTSKAPEVGPQPRVAPTPMQTPPQGMVYYAPNSPAYGYGGYGPNMGGAPFGMGPPYAGYGSCCSEVCYDCCCPHRSCWQRIKDWFHRHFHKDRCCCCCGDCGCSYVSCCTPCFQGGCCDGMSYPCGTFGSGAFPPYPTGAPPLAAYLMQTPAYPQYGFYQGPMTGPAAYASMGYPSLDYSLAQYQAP